MGGVVLLLSAVAALIWVNSDAWASYEALIHMKLGLRLGDFVFERDLRFLVNDGLMTFFFLVAGMEGQLATGGFAAGGGLRRGSAARVDFCQS